MGLITLANDVVRAGRTVRLATPEMQQLIRTYRHESVTLKGTDKQVSVVEALSEASPTKPTTIEQIIDVLTKYIPGESMGMYLLFLPAVANEGATAAQLQSLFLVFLILTPILLAVIYFGTKVAREGYPIKMTRREWIYLIVKALMSAVAFGAWAQTIPSNQAWSFIPNSFVAPSAGGITLALGIADTFLLPLKPAEQNGGEEPPVPPEPTEPPDRTQP